MDDSDISDSFLVNDPTAASSLNGEKDDARQPASPWRWWILFHFVIFTATQSAAWAIPGAITESLEDPQIYGVSAFTTEIWLFYGCLTFVIGFIPFSYWLDAAGGLRGSMLFSMLLVLLGCVLRCVARDASPFSLILLHVSYLLNGFAGISAMGSVGKLSQDWFERTERGIATAIGSEANPFGAAVIFLVGPAIVSVIDMAHVQTLNWLLLGVSIFNTLCVAIYFPSHPPRPPSASATVARDDESSFSLRVLSTALRKLATSRDFLLLLFSYGLGSGFLSSWSSTMQTNLAPFLSTYSPTDIQWKAGIISFSSTVAGNVAGIILGSYIDNFRGHKGILVLCNALGAVFFAIFAAVSSGNFLQGEAAYNALFWSGLLGGLFSTAAVPLYFELSMEAAFGLPSGTVIIVLTTFNNIAGGVFLLVPVAQTGTAWMNWSVSAVLAAISIAILLFYRDDARRARFDAAAAAKAGEKLTAAEVKLLNE